MATTALSGADLTLIRGRQSVENVAIHITPLVTVQTATVDAVPTNQPYVDLDVTWDGAHAAVSVGQLVKIVNGTTLSAWAVVRKSPTASKIFISTTPLGGPGFTTRVETAITAGDTLTVYTHRPLWGFYSRIANRTFFKQWDLAYTDQNTNPPPVANTGAWQSAKVSVGNSASFTLPRLGSNTSVAISGTISTYLWTLPAGVTLQSGFATSDQVIDVDAVAGSHLASLKVTDSSAKTHTAYIWLFVSDGTTGTSLTERYAVNVTSDTNDRTGRTLTLSLTGANLDSVLYPRAAILLREYPNFNGSTLTVGTSIDTFVGYVAEINYTYSEGRISSAEVIVESPMIFAQRIPQPEQSLEEKSSPANWTQATSTLTNPTGAVYYAAKWHMSAILDMHDFDNGSLTTPRRKFIEYPTKTQAEAMEHGARLFNCRVGSASDGTTVLREYPLYMDNTDRNALAVILTWQAQDFSLPYAYQKRLGQVNAIGRTGAFAYNGTQTKAWAAQKRWGQGVGESEMPSFTITMAEGVDRVKEVAGHYLAELNADTPEISLALNKNQDVVDPVYLLWNRLTISSDYDPAGLGESNARMLPTRIDRTWENDDEGGLKKRITLGLQPETFGQPGEEIVIGSYKSNTVNGWSTAIPVPYAPNVGDGFGAIGAALVNDDTGNMAITYNYFEDSPDWTDLSGRFTGAVADFDWDYNSGYFSSGGDATQPLGVYVLSISGTTLYVYRIEDINTLQVTEVTTTTMADSSTTTEARIACSETTADFIVIHWITQASSVIKRSTDGGDTWAANTTVGSTFTDTANDNAPIGLAVDGAKQLCTGWDGSDYKVYYASTTGGAFAALATGEIADNPWAVIRSNEDGFAYGAKTATATSTIVTFDAGGYTTYTDESVGGMTVSFPGTGGNPSGNALGTKAAGLAVNDELRIRINLGADFTVTALNYDVLSNAEDGGGFDAPATMEDRVTLLDNGLSPLDTSIGAFSNNNTWVSRDDTDTGITVPTASVRYVEIGIYLHSTAFGTATLEFRLDNLAVTATGFVGASGAGETHRIATYAGTPAWTDITPAGGDSPEKSYQLVIDNVDSQVVNLITDADKWYSAPDRGDTWTTEETSSAKKTLLTQGDAIMTGGTSSEVKLTLDGTTFATITGNLSAVWASGDTIKHVLAL